MRHESRYRARPLFARPQRPEPPHKPKRSLLRILGGALRRTCTALGAMVLLSGILGGFFSSMALRNMGGEGPAAALPDEMVLYWPLADMPVEHENADGYGFRREKTLTMRDLQYALDEAAHDDRVKGFVVKLTAGGMDLAHIQEVRDAILRFKESGKFTYIYGASYEGLGDYYLASAFDKIWLQPAGIVSIPGVEVEMPFVRDALDKIGVEPQFFARKEYKNLFESLTSNEMSPASREMTDALVASLADTIAAGASQGRGMTPETFRKRVDEGLFTGAQALESGLIDRLDYTDTFNEELKKEVKGDPENDDPLLATVQSYVRDRESSRSFAPAGHKPKVALVYIVGQIVQDDDTGLDLGAAETLVSAIRDVADDDTVDTIVLRIDSPGGDPAAAEAIRRAVVKAQEKGKAVVVSMAGAAASGGYWIAAPADYIFAQPATLTGSIGVTGGKVSLRGLWEKLGVNWDGSSWGENAGLWSFNRPYSPSEAARMDALMDDIYDRFVDIVAKGRHMPRDQAEKLAHGRVWTGAQAQKIGLVDALGGLEEALDYAAGLAGTVDRHGITVEVVPRPRTPFEKIVEFLEMQAATGEYLHSALAPLNGLKTMTGGLTACTPPLMVSR